MGRLFKNWTPPALWAGGVILAAGCSTPAQTPSTITPAHTPSATTLASSPSAATPAQPPEPRQPAPGSAEPADKRFIIAPELASILHVVSVRLNNPANSFLRIQVNLQNMTAAPQRFSYRIEWFDRDGQPLPLEDGGFTTWMLMPHEVSSIAATAPAPTAADFGIAFVPSAN